MKKDAIRIHRTKLTWRGTSCTDFIPDVVPHDPKVPPTAISCRPGTSWDSSICTCRWQFNLWVILNFLLCLGPAEIQMIGFVHIRSTCCMQFTIRSERIVLVGQYLTYEYMYMYHSSNRIHKRVDTGGDWNWASWFRSRRLKIDLHDELCVISRMSGMFHYQRSICLSSSW